MKVKVGIVVGIYQHLNTVLSNKKSALSWVVARNLTKLKKIAQDNDEFISDLIRTYAQLDEHGVYIMHDGAIGNSLFDFDFGANKEQVFKLLKDNSEAEVSVEFYMATKETVEEYLKEKPAPDEYLPLIPYIINDELI